MLDRLKFWHKTSPEPSITIPLKELREGETVWEVIERLNSPKLRESLGDGNAEFLGEGTTEEFLEQERTDKGEDKWYKRILRKE